jgi:uncharacterized protein (DUF1330 family)
MAAYLVLDGSVTDPEKFQAYRKQVRGIVEAYGGKYLAVGKPEKLEGTWNTEQIVIIAFPSIEKAKAWYNSPEYAPFKSIRWRSLTSTFMVLAPGV